MPEEPQRLQIAIDACKQFCLPARYCRIMGLLNVSARVFTVTGACIGRSERIQIRRRLVVLRSQRTVQLLNRFVVFLLVH